MALVEAAGAPNMPWAGVQEPPIAVAQSQSAPPAPQEVSTNRGVVGEIRRQAAYQRVPAAVALAYAKEQSGFRQEAVSAKGHMGVFQLDPERAMGLGVMDVNDWKENVRGGVRQLALARQQHGSWGLAVAHLTNPKMAAAITKTAKAIQSGAYKPSGGSTGVVTLSAPLSGDPMVLSSYGPRGENDFHGGVDLAAAEGTPVHAVIGGKVTFSGWTDGGGHTLSVRDKQGRVWNYLHLQAPAAPKEGDKVQAGDQVGAVGASGVATGPHLDIHLQVNGRYVNPMALLRKAQDIGYGKRGRAQVSATDFLAPGQGGINGAGQPLSGQQQASRDAWQQIANTGQTSPETQTLAAQQGAMV